MKEHKQMYYFKTSSVRPTRNDGMMVLAWQGTEWMPVYFACLYYDDVNNEDPADYYTHWMQMPKEPNAEDKDF